MSNGISTDVYMSWEVDEDGNVVLYPKNGPFVPIPGGDFSLDFHAKIFPPGEVEKIVIHMTNLDKSSWIKHRSIYYVRCEVCKQPKKPGYPFFQWAVHHNPKVNPSSGFIRDDWPRPGLPPAGYLDFCTDHP